MDAAARDADGGLTVHEIGPADPDPPDDRRRGNPWRTTDLAPLVPVVISLSTPLLVVRSQVRTGGPVQSELDLPRVERIRLMPLGGDTSISHAVTVWPLGGAVVLAAGAVLLLMRVLGSPRAGVVRRVVDAATLVTTASALAVILATEIERRARLQRPVTLPIGHAFALSAERGPAFYALVVTVVTGVVALVVERRARKRLSAQLSDPVR